jgi:nucleoprotein TPR
MPLALSQPLPCLSSLSSSPAAGGDFSEALRLLRQEREAAEINLQLAEREVGRLRQEASVAKRAAEEARAQLGAEVERARSAVRDEQDQAALMAKLEQFNLLRESNATLRWVGEWLVGISFLFCIFSLCC